MSALDRLKRFLQRFIRKAPKPSAVPSVERELTPTGTAGTAVHPAEAPAPSGKTEPKAPPHVSAAATPLIPVVLGLDFGTFSTKVVVRRRNERSAVVPRLDAPCVGYPSFALPSLVRVADGRLFFGGRAAQALGGDLYRSLKVSLLKELTQSAAVVGSGKYGLTVDSLVALYLSWVLSQVRKWLDDEYGPNRVNLFVNAAAPMNHYEQPMLLDRYLRILGCAWNAVFGARPVTVEQGVAVHSVVSWLNESLDRGREIEPAATRRFDVLPESVAPIVSLSRDPRMQAGMYLIVDMGAGTAEFSINHAPAPGGDQKVLCYYDQSILLGVEQFDDPPPGESRESLTEQFLRALCRTWGRGYIKDAANHAARQRWKELTVLLIGGGTCRPDLRRKIERHEASVMYAFPRPDRTYRVTTHIPAELEFRPRQAGAPTDAFLLSVAHGLSFPRRTWPEFYPPSTIEPEGAMPCKPKADLPWFEVG